MTPLDQDSEAGPIRLQKVLARAGLGSRRACEELILVGRVRVDGRAVSQLCTQVPPRIKKIAVDGEKFRTQGSPPLLWKTQATQAMM